MLNRKTFLAKYPTAVDHLKTSRLQWEEIEAIHNDYLSIRPNLEPTAKYIAERLGEVEQVHSLKVRIKDPEHLIEKIIRKTAENPSFAVDRTTYAQTITDLIGVRALHLFKEDWLPIHEFIKATWELAEAPVANIRDGDPQQIREAFQKAGCEIKEHNLGYRSIHYLMKSQPSKEEHIAELQVRTIFEEGWSEIDHRIRYPYELGDEMLAQYLGIFNRLAGSADEMGSFVKYLRDKMTNIKTEYKKALEDKNLLIKNLKSEIDQLKIQSDVKQKLGLQLDSLSGITIDPSSVISFSGTLVDPPKRFRYATPKEPFSYQIPGLNSDGFLFGPRGPGPEIHGSKDARPSEEDSKHPNKGPASDSPGDHDK